MPSFPDSVFAPANRSNGQTIDASHMNGVQDEVVALESGFINGTARLNSSVLNVTAGSTFAVRPVEPPPDAVRVSGLTAASTGDPGAAANMSWATQDYITNSSLHSTATNSSRFTPQSTGLYHTVCQVRFSGNSSGFRESAIIDSSGGEVAVVRAAATGADSIFVQAHGTKRFDVLGGFLRVRVGQSSASTLSLFGGADSWCEVRKL